MYSRLYTNLAPAEIWGPNSAKKFPMELDSSIYEEAINKLNQKIRNNPNNAALYLERAIMRDHNFSNEIYNSHNAKECDDDIDKYLKEKKKRARWVYDDFSKVIKLEPNNDLYHYQKGLSVYGSAYTQYGGMSVQEAVNDFSNAIKLNKNDFRYFYSRAIYLQYLDRNSEASKDMATAMRLNPPKNILDMFISCKKYIDSNIGKKQKEIKHIKKIILIIEDKNIQKEIIDFLVNSGFDVLSVEKENAENLIIKYLPDLILLDSRSNLDGIFRRDKRTSNIPIIMMSSLVKHFESRKDNIIWKRLNYGTDEVIHYPPDLEKLVNLINLVDQRIENVGKPKNYWLKILNYGPLILLYESYEVIWFDSLIRLTEIEFQIIYYLLQNHGETVSSSFLLKEIWGLESENTQKIKVHIKNLRKKLEPNPKEPKYILTVFGEGYCLQIPSDHEFQNTLSKEV